MRHTFPGTLLCCFARSPVAFSVHCTHCKSPASFQSPGSRLLARPRQGPIRRLSSRCMLSAGQVLPV